MSGVSAAPADMNMFFPALRALCLAENACQTMHNLCPIRGAKTRDALAWSKYLDAALEDFIEDTDIVSATAKLNAQTITLEAAQAAFARINRRSLFDILG